MKKEYNFSCGERGKFYRSGAKFNLPVYLDGEVSRFIQQIAQKKHSDVSTVVNNLLRNEMQLAEMAKP